jgi:putative transposase
MDPLDLVTQGRIQRYFRATRKLNVPNLVFHITQRAAGKELLFLEDSDYLYMLGLLKEVAINYSLRIHAFCLMPNHVHLLLCPRTATLYDAMRDLFSRYAMRFNRKYERKGHLFGGPYRQAICLDDTYLLAASLYIHMNPVKANLVRESLSYRWSSCRLYCADDAPKSFIDASFVLSLLTKSSLEAKQKYRLLLKQGSALRTGYVLEEEDAIERFCAKLSSMFPSLFKGVERKKRVATLSGIDLLSLEELDRQIEEVKMSFSYKTPESRKAKKYLMEQLIARGFKRAEIAERLGISRKTVYNILKSSP